MIGASTDFKSGFHLWLVFRLIVEAVDRGLILKDPEAPKLSVLTDATMQKISLKKFVAAECRMEASHLKIISVLHFLCVYFDFLQ